MSFRAPRAAIVLAGAFAAAYAWPLVTFALLAGALIVAPLAFLAAIQPASRRALPGRPVLVIANWVSLIRDGRIARAWVLQ